MILKGVGAVCIIISCLGFGMMISCHHKKEVRSLRCLINALCFMENELQFRMPALPDLCRQTAAECKGSIRNLFLNLSDELDNQISPDVKHCMDLALYRTSDIPNETKKCLLMLGSGIGRFDLTGQLRTLESVRKECSEKLEKLLVNSDNRLRSYQTLGLCGGTALIILLL